MRSLASQRPWYRVPADTALIVHALLLVAALPCAAQTVGVRLEVEGVNGAVRENVLSGLSLRSAAREGRLAPERVRRLHARAPEEIRLALQAFGFYQPHMESQLITEGDRWTARYRIAPGAPLKVRNLDLQVRGPGSEDPQLREAVSRFPLAPGNTLHHSLYESGKQTIRERAADRGYLDAVFAQHEIRIDLADYRADIILYLETGPRFRFGPVRMNQDVLDPAVLEGYVTFRRGDFFSESQLLELQRALSGSPYFSRVEVQPRRDQAKELEVPIDVDFVPRRPQRYEVGVGYGTDTGPRGTFEFQQRRLNRRGHRAEGEAKVSLIEQSVAARYIIPSRFPRTEVLTFYAGYAHLDPTTSQSDKIVVGTSVGRAPGPWRQTYSLAFNREWFEVGADTGTSALLIAGTAWSTSRADDRIFSRRGYRLRLELQGSHDAALSDATFLQGRAHGKLISALGGRVRVIGRLDLGRIITSHFRDLPPTVRFFAGGDQSVRGFAYNSVGPLDETGNVVGGKSLLTGSAELEYRVLRSWGLALFYDAGNAFDGKPHKLEQATGMGVRWLSPIGLIRLDGAFAVSRSGAPFRLHIIIGPDL